MKFICKNTCFYRNQLWRPGETLDASDLKEAPAHFVKLGDYRPERKAEVREPRTFDEIQRMQAASILKGVGHTSPNAPHDSLSDTEALLK